MTGSDERSLTCELTLSFERRHDTPGAIGQQDDTLYCVIEYVSSSRRVQCDLRGTIGMPRVKHL
jgi:hypothetical protein